MELQFEPDEGQIRHTQDKVSSATFEGFEADTGKRVRSGYSYSTIIWHLSMGWGIGQIKPHTVDDGHLLPSPRCISETFRVSTATAYKVINLIRKALKIHPIDQKKRRQRGDLLTKFYMQQKGYKRGLDQFHWFAKYFKGRGVIFGHKATLAKVRPC